jgi:dTDP-4-dehydrorhamnose reductase
VVEAVGQEMRRPLVLILGGSGNLGTSLKRVTKAINKYDFHFPSRETLPLQDISQVRSFLEDLKPLAIINAAAWTNVEAAETNEEDARRLNATLPGAIASWCSLQAAQFIHFSSDYVFDGLKREPYIESDQKSPISIYGSSKSEGEENILATCNPLSTIVRTSGLYGFAPNNFVMKVLRKALSGENLDVVVDQQMTPTNCDDLAIFALSLLEKTELPKVIHYSNTGSTNWNEVAREVYKFVEQDPEKVKRIESSDYPSRAKRPRQSRLDTLYPNLTKESNHSWVDSLERFLKEVVYG